MLNQRGNPGKDLQSRSDCLSNKSSTKIGCSSRRGQGKEALEPTGRVGCFILKRAWPGLCLQRIIWAAVSQLGLQNSDNQNIEHLEQKKTKNTWNTNHHYLSAGDPGPRAKQTDRFATPAVPPHEAPHATFPASPMWEQLRWRLQSIPPYSSLVEAGESWSHLRGTGGRLLSSGTRLPPPLPALWAHLVTKGQ